MQNNKNYILSPITTNLAGFRLSTFEVVNWGAFSYAKLDLQGQNALLTGTNGSGKTTLVDAIVTLFVPRAQGFYNQSAGEENSRIGA